MADGDGVARTRGRLSVAMKSFKEEIRAMQNWPWMVITTALLLSVPWVVFISDAVFRFYDTDLALFSAFAVQQVAFALAVWLFAVKGASRLIAVKGILNDVAAVCFCAGMLLLMAVDVLPTGASVMRASCSLVGSLASGAAYGTLFVLWILPYSRHAVSATACVTSVATVLVVVVASIVKVVIEPLGLILYACIYPVVFLAARRKMAGKLPMPIDVADSVSKAEVFVLLDKRKMYAFVGLSYFMGTMSLMSLRTDAPAEVRYLVPVVLVASSLFVVLIVALCNRAYGSISMGLFVVSFAGILIGNMISAFDPLRYAGVFLTLCGQMFLNVFYITYYSGICKRKGISDVRSSVILGKIVLLFPLSLILVWVVLLLEIPFGSDFAALVSLVGGAAMVIVLLAMLCEELTRTRTELAQKQDSTISLKDVMRFAAETKDAYHLTERECEVIQQIMSGRSVATAAKELFLSESTVKTHMRSIYKKLDVHNRQEMIGLINSRMA